MAWSIPDFWFPLATAVVMSITQSSPFDPKTDTNREFVRSPSSIKNRILTVKCDGVGISFVSIFILIYHIFFWVCGLAQSLSWDYAPGVPQGDAANVRVSWREKPIGGFVWRQLLKIANRGNEGSKSPDDQTCPQSESASNRSSGARDEEASIEVVQSTPHSSAHPPHHGSPVIPPASAFARPEVPSRSRRLLAALVKPISTIVAISLLIALVDPLKALFVSFEGGPSWKGPDGMPPLAFVIDTGSFILSSSSTKLSDRPCATDSQVDRCDRRPHDFIPSGCIVRPDGCQAEPEFRPSGLCTSLGLCREDDPPAYHGSVRNPGHDSQQPDTPRVEGSNLRRYLRERHSLCDPVRVSKAPGSLSR